MLEGIVDTHVHSSPDAVPRLLSDFEVAEQAAAAGYRAVVLKSHHTVTAARAQLVDERVDGVRVLGGLALNLHASGGVNPLAVEAALRMGASVIWMPTITSASQVRVINAGGGDRLLRAMVDRPVAGIEILQDGVLLAEVIEVLDLIAQHDATLATGHLCAAEVMKLVPEARRRGVARVIVNHPEMSCVALGLEEQATLARLDGVWLERVYVMTLPHVGYPVQELAASIRKVGVERTILATDLGQVGNPTPVDGMARFIDALAACGFSDEQLRVMTSVAPALAVNLADDRQLQH